MRRLLVWTAAFLLPVAAAAQIAPRLSGPVAGVVFDREARALRPVVGMPGASYLGDPLASGVEAASVSPDGSMALATIGGQTMLISGLPQAAQAILLDVPAATRFAWSPGGEYAAVCSEGEVRILRAIRTSPASGPAIAVPAEATTLAISDAGDLAAALDSGIYLLAPGAAPRLAASFAATAIAFRQSDLFAAAGGRIVQIRYFASSPAISEFAAEAGEIVGLQFSSDGKRLFAVDAANRAFHAYDVASHALTARVELEFAPSELTAIGGRDIWLMQPGGGGASPMWVGTGSNEPAVYFVPAGRVEQ